MAYLSGNDNDSVIRDTDNSPQSENETEELQKTESTEDEVKVLPGTGGPDDFGDISVSSDDLNL